MKIELGLMSHKKFERKRDRITTRIAYLEEEYDAVANQRLEVLAAGDDLRLKRQADRLENEIDELYDKLDEIENFLDDKPKRLIKWRSKLPKINFREAARIFDHINNYFGQDGGAATFLMQNGNAMGGEWCVQRLKGLLETTDLKHYRIEFTAESHLNLPGLLARFGEYVGCEPIAEQTIDTQVLQQYTSYLSERVGASLQSGSVVLTEIHVWNNTGFHDQFLPQYLHDFWCPFIDALPEITQRHPMVKFITLIVVNSPLHHTHLLTELYCDKDHFDSQKVVEIPLQPWTVDEITEWLFYVGLTAKLQQDAIRQMAQTIYQASDGGRPSLVEMALMKNLQRYFD